MRQRGYSAWSGLALLLAASLLAGCGSSNITGSRALAPNEADRLLALQRARDKAGETDSEVKLDPARLESHGDMLARQGDIPAALYQYSRAIGLAEPEVKRRLRLKVGEASLKGGMFVPAEQLFQELCQAEPKNPVLWQGLGLALFAQNRLEDAEPPLKKALELDPKLWRSHNALGIMANRQHRPAQALTHFKAALAQRPDLPALYNNQALSHMLLGNLSQAESSLRQALTLDPGYRLAYNNLGMVLTQRGRHREALRAFERGSGPAQAHNNLGTVLAWQGDYDRALDHFQQAREVMPRYYPLAERHLEALKDRSAQTGPPILSQPAANHGELPVVERPSRAASPQASAAPIQAETVRAEPRQTPPTPPAPAATVEKPRPVLASLPLEPASPAPTKAPAATQPASLAQPGQSLPVGLVGFVSEKDEADFVEGVAVSEDGKLHRVQGYIGSLSKRVAVSPGGDAGEGHGAQAVPGRQLQ